MLFRRSTLVNTEEQNQFQSVKEKSSLGNKNLIKFLILSPDYFRPFLTGILANIPIILFYFSTAQYFSGWTKNIIMFALFLD